MCRSLLFVMLLTFSMSIVAGGLPSDYQKLSYQEKENLLWSKIVELPYSNDALPSLGSLPGYKKLLAFFNLYPSFDRSQDEMPYFRQKFIHPFGVVAKIQFVSDVPAKYSGIFKGANGLARLSLAGDPKAIGFTPGMALKFFISGQPSVNIHVMNSVNGQSDDYNFFAKEFSNIIPPAQGLLLKMLETWFKLFVDPANMLSVDHFSLYTQEGIKEENPSYPQQIILVPTTAISYYYQSLPSDMDFRLKLMALPLDSVLYDVYGKAIIEGESPLFHIGQIVLKSSFVASQYEDEKLFFQHRRWTK